MSYAIVGFGEIGQALAHAFARKNINLTVASRRPPEALAPEARAIGPTVVAKSLRDALKADTIILAVPFGEHREVAKALPSWEGKTVIDATNAFGVGLRHYRSRWQSDAHQGVSRHASTGAGLRDAREPQALTHLKLADLG